jgi:methylated-DNA-protein-cysteine methyltransferase-like protein
MNKNIKTSAKNIDKKLKQSSFFQNVYEIVAHIPYGRVTSYGSIAKALGASNSSRLVGYAMNECHSFHSSLPAHRVVNRNGLLTGKHHFATETTMQELLEAEGIKIVNDQIQNFKELFWDPSIELL